MTTLPLALAICVLLARSSAAPPLSLNANPTAFVATGVSAHGQVVLVGISRGIDPEDDVVSIHRQAEVLADDDGDGSVTLDLGRSVPQHSMWIAVDLTSGSAAFAAPPWFRLRNVAWRGHGAMHGPSRDVIEDNRPYAEVFVVRPGVGAWTSRVGDGGPTDADGVPNGKLQAALDAMTPLPGSPAAPAQFQPSDVVILMDPNALEFTVARAGAVL
jgi:hypothetical protein